MTRVMDGVRPTSAHAAPLQLPRRRPEVQPAGRNGYRAGGMDGLRRKRLDSRVATDTGQFAYSRPVRQFSWPAWAGVKQLTGVGMAVVAVVVSVLVVHAMSGPKVTTASAATDTPIAAAKPTPTAQVNLAAEQSGLDQLLRTFVANYQNDGKYNIVVKDLSTGAEASVNPDQSYMSASLYKLFVADQIYHMIDTGQLSYGTAAGGGSGNTVSGCLKLMITISDNTCGRALGSILGWGSQNPALASEGFTETDLTTPQQTSARDVGSLLEDLYKGTLDSPASNLAFLGLLKDQKVNDRLPQGLPVGTVIAHKTGNLDDVVHDAGIVYGPKTNYLVVVMSGGWTMPGNAPPQFAALSRQLWNYFEQ